MNWVTISVIVGCQPCRNDFTNYTNQNQIERLWKCDWFVTVSQCDANDIDSQESHVFRQILDLVEYVSYNSNQALPKIRQDFGISYISLVATTETFSLDETPPRRRGRSCKLHIRNVDVFYYTLGTLTDCYFDAK